MKHFATSRVISQYALKHVMTHLDTEPSVTNQFIYKHCCRKLLLRDLCLGSSVIDGVVCKTHSNCSES